MAEIRTVTSPLAIFSALIDARHRLLIDHHQGRGPGRIDGNLLHGTAPFHVVVATTTLWYIDAAIAGPFHISKSRQVKGKWPDQPLDHHSGCPS